MKNIPFVIWMLGFPFVQTINDFVYKYLLQETYPDSVEAATALVFLMIWIGVGSLLYEKKKEKQ